MRPSDFPTAVRFLVSPRQNDSTERGVWPLVVLEVDVMLEVSLFRSDALQNYIGSSFGGWVAS